MEYVKGKPYFAFSDSQIKQYPYLNKDISCEILIIGGGIDGSIVNYYLSKLYDVVLVDKGRLAKTCTSCATALCEYQLDDYANDLKKEMTDNEICEIYRNGLKSIKKFENFINKNGNECMFTLCPSFLYSTSKKGASDIEKEFIFRKNNHFTCELFDKNNNPFPFEIENGLYCSDGGCSFNPYLLAKQHFENAKNQNNIFENTDIASFYKTKSGFIALTSDHNEIKCKKIIFCTGFNWELLDNKELCERFTTYTIVTKPIHNIKFYNNALVEDDLQPYHYFRVLPDNRIIYGGEDKKWKSEIKVSDAEKAYENLLTDLKKLLPKYSNKISVDYRFCGCFGSTNNNVGIISEANEEGLYYFFSCGANGIINSNFGVELLLDIFNKKENSLIPLFSINRKVY